MVEKDYCERVGEEGDALTASDSATGETLARAYIRAKQDAKLRMLSGWGRRRV